MPSLPILPADLTELSDEQLKTIAIIDVRDEESLPSGLVDWLDGDGLARYISVIGQLIADMDRQFGQFNRGELPNLDQDWKRQTAALKDSLIHELHELKQILKDRNMTKAAVSQTAMWNGIKRHQEATLAEEIEPNEYDLALWALVSE